VAGALQVDVEGLRTLARDLAGIQQDFRDLGADFGMYDSVLGAQAVKQELSKVAGNWKKSRRRIDDELAELGRMVSAAADRYAATEADLSQAFTRRGSPGPAGDTSGG
jgi:uncharacterized protein YukE